MKIEIDDQDAPHIEAVLEDLWLEEKDGRTILRLDRKWDPIGIQVTRREIIAHGACQRLLDAVRRAEP